jgi:hypothetical protein
MMSIQANSIIPLVHIHVSDTGYNVYISMCTVTRNMHIFKYNDQCCAYEIFHEQGAASRWLELPLTPPISYLK